MQIMARLRAPDGCPWDQRQTMKDLKAYLLDETYEVAEAIDSGNRSLLCEELGDLLFQIIFLAHMAQEEGAFQMDDVIRGIEEKMIRRHPHVFAEGRAATAQDVLRQWEAIKVQEGKKPRTSVLSGVSRTLPSLYRAYRLGHRAARVGFDWERREEILAKVREELGELEVSIQRGDLEEAGEELGDLLFVLANVARHLGREPEGLLRKANAKFTRRFAKVEETLVARGTTPAEASLEEMDRLWDAAKAEEKKRGPRPKI